MIDTQPYCELNFQNNLEKKVVKRSKNALEKQFFILKTTNLMLETTVF